MIKKALANWTQFTLERFHPLSHFVMIGLFVLSHLLVCSHALSYSRSFESQNLLLFIGALLLSGLFFFKLRLYDELKDYDTDIVEKPHRPLPRGLLKPGDLKKAIAIIIPIELIIVAAVSPAALPILVVAICYSLLMFKEFFIGNFLRPHLTSYAVSHTFVTVLLSLTLFSVFTQTLFHQLDPDFYLFSASTWFLFNIFEFARKTYAGAEEVKDVLSYSKIWGRYGAVALTGSQAILATYLIIKMRSFNDPLFTLLISVLIIATIAIGIIYAQKNSHQMAKLYRSFSSIFIIIFLIILSWRLY